MRVLSIISTSIVLLLILATTPQVLAEPEFRGGVVYPTSIQRVGEGPATITVSAKQSFNAPDGEIFSKGVSILYSSSEDAPGTVTYQGPLTDLQSEMYGYSALSGKTRTISASTLDCQNPEDKCRGCVGAIFYTDRRIGSAVNIDADNVDSRVYTRFSVATGNIQLSPKYTGDLQLNFLQGATNTYDLKPHISHDGGFKCLMTTASASTGIEYNPSAGGLDLELSDDCVLSWDTSGTQVGEKYVVKVSISSTADHDCPIYTEVDLLIEIGCSEAQISTNDPSCFLCAGVPVQPLLDQMIESTEILHKRAKQAQRKGIRKARELDPTSFEFFNVKRKLRRVFKKKFLPVYEDLMAQLAAHPGVMSLCAAPSSLYCSTSDFTGRKVNLLESGDELFTAYKRLLKAMVRAVNRASGNVGGDAKKKRGIKAKPQIIKNQKHYDRFVAAGEQLPVEEITCGL